MMTGVPPSGGRASKPPKRLSTYDSPSPPLAYSPSLMTSMPISRCSATTPATIWRSAASSSLPARSVPSGRGRLPTWVVRIFLLLLRFMRIPGNEISRGFQQSRLLRLEIQHLGQLLHVLPFVFHGLAHLLGRAGQDRRAVLFEPLLQVRILRRLDEQVMDLADDRGRRVRRRRQRKPARDLLLAVAELGQ